MPYLDQNPDLPHKLEVVAWNAEQNYHDCKIVGQPHCGASFVRVDLFTDGGFPIDFDPNSLIGKTVSVRSVQGFLWIAADVRVEPSPAPDLVAAPPPAPSTAQTLATIATAALGCLCLIWVGAMIGWSFVS